MAMVSFSRCHHHLPLIQLVVVSSRPTFCLLSRSIPTAMNMKARRLAISLSPLATLDLNTIVGMIGPLLLNIALGSAIFSVIIVNTIITVSSFHPLPPPFTCQYDCCIIILCPSVDLLPVISVVAVVIIIFITIILIDDCSRVPLPLP